MTAGRKPAPAALKLLQGVGNGRDSGGRPVGSVPAFKRVPPAKPEDLSAEAGALWDAVVAELGRLDVLKPLDGPALQMACETYARWCEAHRKRQNAGLLSENSQGTVTAPWVGIEERAAREFRIFCAEFGWTPAAEARLATGGLSEDPDNPFAG